jgi:hypothetical protein
MPTIPASQLQVNVSVTGAAPDATLVIRMDQPLAIGTYVFQLEAVDSAGNRSQPVLARVAIVDRTAPTAIISAPREVPFNTEFTLSGIESRDAGGGTIAQYIWTMLQP